MCNSKCNLNLSHIYIYIYVYNLHTPLIMYSSTAFGFAQFGSFIGRFKPKKKIEG